MASLTRADIKAPVLRKQAVACPALGGDVVLRMLTLSERLVLHEHLRKANKSDDARGRYAQMAELLAVAAIDADSGLPLFSAAEWDIFAAEHTGDAMALLEVARRLSGFDAEDVEKN